jgi:hypothetical protein
MGTGASSAEWANAQNKTHANAARARETLILASPKSAKDVCLEQFKILEVIAGQ